MVWKDWSQSGLKLLTRGTSGEEAEATLGSTQTGERLELKKNLSWRWSFPSGELLDHSLSPLDSRRSVQGMPPPLEADVQCLDDRFCLQISLGVEPQDALNRSFSDS